MKPAAKSIIIQAFFLLISIQVIAQSEACKARESATKMIEGYTFIKNYLIDQTTESVEYSYVFSNKTTYILVMTNSEGSAQNVLVELMDSNKKLTASNYDKKMNKFYPALIYQCKSTSLYYLKYTFKQHPDCFASMLAFKK